MRVSEDFSAIQGNSERLGRQRASMATFNLCTDVR
jgi:hypothetical protein